MAGSIQIKVRCMESNVVMKVSRMHSLRDVQQELCISFKRRFPAMKANLVIEGKVWDDFHHQPFAKCEDGAQIVVEFVPTDDPYFYDVADRRRPKSSFHDDMQSKNTIDDVLAAPDLLSWEAPQAKWKFESSMTDPQNRGLPLELQPSKALEPEHRFDSMTDGE